MAYKSTEYLVKLVESLSPAEKRHFRLQVKKNNHNGDTLFMNLFEYLDKYKSYNEQQILNKIPKIRKAQLSNLKSTLYKQLLASLRLQHRNNSINITIRENIDYAVVLYNKGLYNAALDTLDKVKQMALDAKKYSAVIMILELEKKIESLYVTGSMYPKAKQLTKESNEVIDKLEIIHQLSNLSLSLYGIYLQRGFVNDNQDFDYVTDYFKVHLPSVSVTDLGFYGRLYYYQSHVWYHFMVQDFPNYYRYSTKWVELFDEDKSRWLDHELTFFIKGHHNLLNATFMSRRFDKFSAGYEHFINICEERYKGMNVDEKKTYHSIRATHGINYYFMQGDYEKGLEFINQNQDILSSNELGPDLNRELSLQFKMGCLYFSAGDHDQALVSLHRITNQVYPDFREDIQCFARLLSLIIHFEKGNERLITHQVVSLYRYLSKVEHLQKALKVVMSFLRRLPKIKESDLREAFIKLHDKLIAIEGEDFERKPFLYLDIIAWLESKIENVPLKHTLQRRITTIP